MELSIDLIFFHEVSEIPGHERPGASEKSLVSSSYDSVEVAGYEVAG